MAMNVAAAPTVVPSSTAAYNMRHQQPSPLSSASSTPDTSSIASPRGSSVSPPNGQSQFPRRQIRAPKTPMYIPAVLRPTESPAYWRAMEQRKSGLAAALAANKDKPQSQQAVITPPSSAGTSFDDVDGNLGELARQNVNELPQGKITRIVTEEWNPSRAEDVLGSPTKSHWKPDSHSLQCESERCEASFNIVVRRHHCRRCGKIFCSSHSMHVVPLNQNAAFHARGEKGRACDDCWQDYKHWERVQRSRRTNSVSSTMGSSGSEVSSGTVTPVGIDRAADGERPVSVGQGKAAPNTPKMILGSFCSRDWNNWSTF